MGGNDTLDGGTGADVMHGGNGDDTFFVDSASDVVKEANGGGTDRVYASGNYVLSAGQSIETLSTTNALGTGAINLTGNALGQYVYGNAGANVLNGGGGADYMAGYGGNDSYYVDNALDRTIEAAGGGTDRVYASVNYVLEANREIETLSTTDSLGTGAINLTGNALGQNVFGNAGVNVLNGGGGVDLLAGYGGNDSYFVDNALDRTLEAAGGGTDRVYASVNYVLEANREIETLSTANSLGTGAINLTGNAFANTVMGNAGANVLNGGGGADVIASYGGNDIILFNTALGPSNIDKINDFVVANDTIHLENAVFT